MKLKIDIEGSIEKGRLYPKSMLSFYSDYFMYGFIALVFLICLLGMLNESNFQISSGLKVGIFIYAIIFPLVFYFLSKMNKLTILNIKDKIEAKQYIHSLAAESNWKIIVEDDQILLLKTNPWYLHERQVTFIFRNRKVFINVMSFGRNVMSPLYYSSDKENLKLITDKLNMNGITVYDKFT
jgi:hypothetical protein